MKKRLTVALMAAMLLAGCGLSASDKETLENLKNKITTYDTEVSSMYGKIEDMHQSELMDDDRYMEFIDLRTEIGELSDKADENKPNVKKLEQEVTDFEGRFSAYKADLDKLNAENDASLSMELIQLYLATEDLSGVVERAFNDGKIEQSVYDEFVELKAKVDKYYTNGNIQYDTKFKESFNEIRSRLTTIASQAGADNALIDRIIGTADSENQETGEEVNENTEEKKPLSEDVQKLIDDYLLLQNYAIEQQSAGKMTDTQVAELLQTGVQLTYLKEAVEKDGVTENNTYTANDIKQKLYDFSVGISYEKAEDFK